MSEPTQRQLDFIEYIEGETGVEFTGSTKEEASVYIDENLDYLRALEAAEMEAEHGDYGCRDE